MSITTRAALVVACALPALGAGCVESEGTLVLTNVAAATAVAVDPDTGECVSGEVEEGGAGVVFPAACAGRAAMIFNATLRNQMAEDTRPSTLRVRARDVVLTEYELEVTSLAGSTGVFRVPGSGFVPSGQGVGQFDEGETQFFVGDELTEDLDTAQTAVLAVRYFGRTTGGDDVETPWFYYPIIVAE